MVVYDKRQMAYVFPSREYLSTPDIIAKNIEISKSMEERRIELADAIVNDEHIWGITRNTFPYKFNGITKGDFSVLPRYALYNGIKTADFFSNLEKKLNENSNGSLKVGRILDGIYKDRNQMVEINLPLVIGAIKDYKNIIPRNSYMDIFDGGVIGLIKAAHKFDYKFGNLLLTYALPAIHRDIRRALNNERLITVAEKVGDELVQFQKFISMYEDANNGDVDFEVLSKKLKISRNKLERFMGYIALRNVVSMNDSLVKNGNLTLEGVIKDESGLDFLEDLIKKDIISKVRGELNGRDAEIFDMRINNGASFLEIANIYGISKERVRQILGEAGAMYRILSVKGVNVARG